MLGESAERGMWLWNYFPRKMEAELALLPEQCRELRKEAEKEVERDDHIKAPFDPNRSVAPQ